VNLKTPQFEEFFKELENAENTKLAIKIELVLLLLQVEFYGVLNKN
jgi:hypothetical protein